MGSGSMKVFPRNQKSMKGGGGVLLTCLGNLLWEYYSTGKKKVHGQMSIPLKDKGYS